MSRLIPQGCVILTPSDARMLEQGAGLSRLREQSRVGNSNFYHLLVDIRRAALSDPDAARGIEPRQSAASDEAEWWTVKQVADAARLAPRTVRLDIERESLPATKSGGSWLVVAQEAKTYVERRRKH